MRDPQCPLDGIDYLEVAGKKTLGEDLRQRVLKVFFVPKPSTLMSGLAKRFPSRTVDDRKANAAKVSVTGGERVQKIRVDSAAWKRATKRLPAHLEVHVSPRGDYSTYTLSLVEPGTGAPLKGLDPQLASVDFSFKVECPSDFDCLQKRICPPTPLPVPEFDYLAKDYASFRQLILDRMSALVPGWTERNPSDLGITLVELLAYVGDYLSYRQDAIATEAYLGTARQRISVRRHTRLLDYPMHDGYNARVWVQVRLDNSEAGALTTGVVLPRMLVNQATVQPENEPVPAEKSEENVTRTRFATQMPAPTLIDATDLEKLLSTNHPVVFEPMEDVTLYPAHNRIPFYTWGDARCCLPKGATKAALLDSWTNGEAGRKLQLKPGDVLIFKEEVGPKTGNEADADPMRRHAVRLTRVTPGEDEVIQTDENPTPYVEIEWDAKDALPFPFCLSSVTDEGKRLDSVSVALGNIVLADHGMTILRPESLGSVPTPNPVLAPASDNSCCACGDEELRSTPLRFQPLLQNGPLTQAARIVKTQEIQGRRVQLHFDSTAPASTVFDWDSEHVMPEIRLGDDSGSLWLPQRDLLSSEAFATEFVVETDNDARAHIRFGDDENGMRPGEGREFWVLCRVGNGTAGNVGTESIVHLIGGPPNTAPWMSITGVTNPLPARGGLDPETSEEARLYAPQAFRANLRAVTPDDYARFAEKNPEVQRALATMRWTGSWHTVFLAIDRLGGREVDSTFKDDLLGYLEPYRMAGQDLEIVEPVFEPLKMKMTVCLKPNYYWGDVEAELLDVFSTRLRSDGTRGFFHPDNYTFGDPVYLSWIYAAAQAVQGVGRVEVTALQPLSATKDSVPDNGVLTVQPAEIIRLDNDPNFPDRGLLQFTECG